MRSGQGGQPGRVRQMGGFGYSALTPEVSLKYGPAAPLMLRLLAISPTDQAASVRSFWQ